MENNEEKSEIKGINGSIYLIEKRIGSGGQANVFLVTKKGDTEKLAAKIFKSEGVSVDIEIKILSDLNRYNNPYIIKIKDSGKGDIIRINRETKKNMTYFVLENAPNGNIFDYIYVRESGLGEPLSKILFQQILYGVQCIHEHNICHLDIKLENILLNDKYIPKICDFGHAFYNSNDIAYLSGTEEYRPPEVDGNNKYDGIKVDIFYLASVLMLLTTGLPGFKKPVKSDYFFIDIINENSVSYWAKVDKQIERQKIELSGDFKDLFFKMISIKPEKRPNINDILKHAWFKEIDDMKINDPKKFNALNKEISDIFSSLSESVKKYNQKEMEAEEKESEKGLNRSGSDDTCFDPDLRPKYLDTPLKANNCINIKGHLDPVEFMNELYETLKNHFGDNCPIIPDDKKLKFKIDITEESEDENDEREITMIVKLYKYSNDHILRFIQKEGNRRDFLDKFKVISDLVQSIIS